MKRSVVFILSWALLSKCGLYDNVSAIRPITVANELNATSLSTDCIVVYEFYNSYCGACRAFAPTFIRLARHFGTGSARFVATDCSHDIQICQKNHIRAVPTIELYSPERGHGRAMTSRKLEELIREVEVAMAEATTNLKCSSFAPAESTTAIGSATVMKEEFGMGPAGSEIVNAHRATISDYAAATIIVLQREIPMAGEVTKEVYSALHEFVWILAHGFPSHSHRPIFASLLKEMNHNLTIETWTSLVRNITIAGVGSDNADSSFITCRGSTKDLRGFSCALWKLFHSLVANVQFWHQARALKAVHGFVKYFFTCRDCREHFMLLSEKMEIQKVTNYDAVLWLWKAHNRVNVRLANDSTTNDPKFPKTSFPTRELCRQCFNGDGTFKTLKVDRFLRWLYRPISKSELGPSLPVNRGALSVHSVWWPFLAFSVCLFLLRRKVPGARMFE